MKKIRVSHILVEREYEINDILKKLADGVSFEQLAKDFSTCSSATSGGDLGDITPGKTVRNFEKTAFALQVGEVSSLVKSQFGYHLIKRLS